MHLEQLNTFLSVVETGNFNKTAERLSITQAAVSSRIRQLEEELGCALFTRGRFGALMTASGERFQSVAKGIVRRWSMALLDAALPPGCHSKIRIGSQISLHDSFVTNWTLWMCNRHPNIALHLEAYYSPSMLDMLNEGSLDIAIMYQPKTTADLQVETLFVERFLLVSSNATHLGGVDPDSYIFIDWSPFFCERHRDLLPQFCNVRLTTGLGAIALQFLKVQGGAAYYPDRTARQLVAENGFSLVKDAPIIEQQVYTVFSAAQRNNDCIQISLSGLRDAVQNCKA